MNTPETITAEILGTLIILAALGVLAAAREWVAVSLSASARFVPAAKRTPRTPVNVVNVLPDSAQDGQDKPLRRAM